MLDHEYRFSATQNDGRLTQRKDWISGEETSYQYDSLNRLISAVTMAENEGARNPDARRIRVSKAMRAR